MRPWGWTGLSHLLKLLPCTLNKFYSCPLALSAVIWGEEHTSWRVARSPYEPSVPPPMVQVDALGDRWLSGWHNKSGVLSDRIASSWVDQAGCSALDGATIHIYNMKCVCRRGDRLAPVEGKWAQYYAFQRVCTP